MISAIVLNWNELHVVKDTIELLLKEPDVEVVIVDNGSRDGSAEYFSHMSKRPEYQTVKWALLGHNHGSSVARNVGIDISKGEDIFLIDGDILYVPGTIKAYSDILHSVNKGWRAGCVGYNDHHRVQMTGMNGVDDPAQAVQTMPGDFTLSNWFPMAWTQYGLFDGDLLREIRFHDKGCFGEFGHGYEDDWLFHEMQEHQYASVAVNAPLYFHDGHYSLRLLKQMGLPDRGAERAEAFYEKWGRENGWRERMATIPEEDRKPYLVRVMSERQNLRGEIWPKPEGSDASDQT